MSTQLQRNANRQNAKASTGPKTTAGKAHSSQNALRHGLSVISVYADPALSEKVESLTRKIAGGKTSPRLIAMAREVAEAQVELIYIRTARNELINRELRDPYFGLLKKFDLKLKQVLGCIRANGPDAPAPNSIADMSSHRLESHQKILSVISDLSSKLLKFDRYEQRALSRRKFAIRDFTAAMD
jgi:hypothetical protein